MNETLINQKAKELSELLDVEQLDPRKGLPEELFLLASCITPIPNVDLMVFDNENRILLSWRDDIFFGQGWHIVGGCIRMHETMEERVKKCALQELGSNALLIKHEPLAIRDSVSKESKALYGREFVRSHNLSVLFKCLAQPEFDIIKMNEGKYENSKGYLKWFGEKPMNILPALEETYGDILNDWNDGKIKF